MDEGRYFTYPANCFPRYDYFKRRLDNFVPRLKGIIDASDGADCIHDASLLLEEILQDTQGVQDTVDIVVFPEDVNVRVPVRELVVVTLESNSAQESDSHWGNDETIYLRTKPEFRGLFSKSSKDDTPVVANEISWRRLQSTMNDSLLPACSAVVFVISTDECLYDLHSKVASVRCDTNFLVYNINLKTCYRHTGGAWKCMTLTDSSLAKTIQIVFEEMVIDIFEKIGMLIEKFVLRGGKTLACTLDELVRQSTYRILNNEFILNEIASIDNQQDGVVEKQNERFKQNLITAVKKQTRCTLVETLSEKYGIPQAVALSLLGERHFGLDERLSDIRWTIYIPVQMRIDKLIEHIRRDSERYAQNLPTNFLKLIADADKYIQSKVHFFEKLKKLEFELHGILQMTKVPLTIVIPEIPSLSSELQEEIFGIEEVQSCGHVYGKLTIMVTDLKETDKKYIQYLLRTYKYFHGYTIREMSPVAQAGSDIRNGHRLQVQSIGNCTDFNLGCFVHLDLGFGLTLDDVYAISCGHCISNCWDMTLASYLGEMRDFGTADNLLLYRSRFLDIVAIKMSTPKTHKCNFNVKQPGNVEKDASLNYYQGKTFDRLKVYKHGYGSDLTTGTVVNSDTVIKAAEVQENDNHVNDSMYQILVEPQTDEIQSSPFSKRGDSGSIVCVHGSSGDSVDVLALLCESFEARDTYAYICTYGSNFERLIKEFESQFNVKVILASPHRKAFQIMQ